MLLKEYYDSIVNEIKVRELLNYLPLFNSNFFKINVCVAENMPNYKIIVLPLDKSPIMYFYYLLTSVALEVDKIKKKKIKPNYDSYSQLKSGQTINIGESTVIFKGIEIINETKYICLKCLDTDCKLLLEKIPWNFRLNPYGVKLTTYKRFIENNKVDNDLAKATPEEKFINSFFVKRNGLNKVFIFLSSITETMDYISGHTFKGTPLKQIFNFAKLTTFGEIKPLISTKFQFIPEILLASDLYSIVQAVENKSININTIFIDGRKNNSIINSLDQLDILIKLNIPITIISNEEDSLNLRHFLDRNFAIWKWSPGLILALTQTNMLDKKTLINLCNHCDKTIITTVIHDSKIEQISKDLNSLNKQVNKYQSIESPLQVIKQAYFSILRSPISFDEEITNSFFTTITNFISEEKRFLSPAIINTFDNIITNIKNIITTNRNQKLETLKDACLKNINICIIVPDKMKLEKYKEICKNLLGRSPGRICTPDEYLTWQGYSDNLETYIMGWFSRTIMLKLLVNCKTKNIHILLYTPEYVWFNSAIENWKNNSCLKEINDTKEKYYKDIKFPTITNDLKIKHISEDEGEGISTVNISDNINSTDPIEDVDIDEDIDKEILNLIIAQEKAKLDSNKTYSQNNNQKKSFPKSNNTEVHFNDGSKLTYSPYNRVIVLDALLKNKEGNIKVVNPKDLQKNNYIIVRERDKDLITEIASKILHITNLDAALKTCGIWKDKLKSCQLSEKELVKQLHDVGCTRTPLTIHKWIYDEEMICPQNFEDLKFIAQTVKDQELTANLNKIFEAGYFVKNAHKSAGKYLTSLLIKRLKDKRIKFDDINKCNIMETINIKDIGTIKILKITDINTQTVGS